MKKTVLFTLCVLLCLMAAGCGATNTAGETDPVVIGIIDTGISSKAIPAESVLEGKNYVDPTASTEDTYGHGTAVASVILAHAPDAKLVPLISNMYDKGALTQVDNDVLAQMIVDAVDLYGCDIINISAGLVLDKTSIREAVAYAEEQNVLVVASAGNDYATQGDFMYYPAGYKTVLAVGSVNEEGTAVSEFSQRGPWIDLYACGEAVTITTLSGNSRESDGTSYSAARVTAFAAELLQRDSTLTASHLRQKILTYTRTTAEGQKYLP